MADNYILKSITKDGMFRAYAIQATGVVAEAQKRQDTWSASSAALGRSMVAGLLLSASSLKGQDTMTIKINGGGPVGGIMVDANANGQVKGYIQQPHVNLPLNKHHKIDVGKAVGVNGFLQVIKNTGNGEPYTSSVPLASGEIGDDFTYYLAQSEQIPSAVGVSVFVNPDNTIGVAGGYLVQKMPGASDEAISKLEKRLKEMPMVSELLLDHQTPENILDLIFGKDNLNLLDKMPVEFHCSCSKKRFGKVLGRLSTKQLKQLIDEDHGAETVCHFCGAKYQFSETDLKKILLKKDEKKQNDQENQKKNEKKDGKK